MAEHGISVMEFQLTERGVFPPLPLSSFDYIMLKIYYRTPDTEAEQITRRIRSMAPETPLIFMDGDDDACVQWGAVPELVDVYVKGQAFRDVKTYQRQFRGKSNLHEYAIEQHGHALGPLDYGNPGEEPLVIEHSGTVREEDLDKLVVGWNMATASDIINLWQSPSNQADPVKTVDCVFRGSVKVETITGYQRAAVKDGLSGLADRFDIRFAANRVPLNEYYDELRASRICVSPFGFGELCWRDFEAVLCRSLLIKPDMSHLITYPDIYQPFETYVPVRWDLSDLEEKCAYYLEHHEQRQRIARKAFGVLTAYLRSFGFAQRLEAILLQAAAGRS
jgi:hypothetical protein